MANVSNDDQFAQDLTRRRLPPLLNSFGPKTPTAIRDRAMRRLQLAVAVQTA